MTDQLNPIIFKITGGFTADDIAYIRKMKGIPQWQIGRTETLHLYRMNFTDPDMAMRYCDKTHWSKRYLRGIESGYFDVCKKCKRLDK